MLKRVLVANRGEIARRVIRTARRLGIETVAIYSDVDAASIHVAEADESIRLPGATAGETYLNIEMILKAARSSGADGVHPGYGFLSENADFAAACGDSGYLFIGPTTEAIRHLGNKTTARSLAIENNVPVNPGTPSAISTIEHAREAAEAIGYPVLLKAASGGGGKGMRIVASPNDLENGLRAARGEAMTSFNDDSVFLERYIIAPRHIELQVLADTHGNVAVLGERECSVQRRHQKVVEEAPSIVVDDSTRQVLFAAAERMVKASNYTNAGTLEFLMDSAGRFAFLEVNTRLQVEHPVTEMITGLDLVEWQFRIASGEQLPFSTGSIAMHGHAIECRICAEDVRGGFLPCSGVIHESWEPAGEYIRVDSALYNGMPVSLYYDPMLAKLIVWGETRDEAIRRMVTALEQYHIAGVATTIPFCQFVMNHSDFQAGTYTTAFVEEHWTPDLVHRDDLRAIAAAAAVRTHRALELRMSTVLQQH